MSTSWPRRPIQLRILAILSVLLLAGCASAIRRPERRPDFSAVDRLLEGYRERSAFPGGVLAVGFRGNLVHLFPFGRQTGEPAAPRVTAETLYDLASLTKVVATTTMAMILVDEGKLDLDRRVQAGMNSQKYCGCGE
jgi:CubicO group peptidase (beta-lactamase class C family)